MGPGTLRGEISSPLAPGALGHHPHQPLHGQEAPGPQVLNPPESREPFHKAGDGTLMKKALASQSLKLIHLLKEGCEFASVLDPLANCFYPGLLVFRISADLAHCASSSQPPQL